MEKVDERFKYDNKSSDTSREILRILRENSKYCGEGYIKEYIEMLSSWILKEDSIHIDLIELHDKVGILASTVEKLNQYHKIPEWKVFSILCYCITSSIIMQRINENKEIWKDVDEGIKYLTS